MGAGTVTWAQETVENIGGIISYMESTAEDSWQMNVVRSKDGTKNCFFGHLFNMGGDDERGSALWGWFEERWATTYMIYPVNDGENPDYPQPTPKQRILAYLRDLSDGTAKSVPVLMEEEYQRFLAAERGE